MSQEKWANRFVVTTVIQGVLAIGLTAFLLYEAVFGIPAASRIVAGGGAGMWLTVGYLGYLVLGLLATGMMAFLYRHLEMHVGKAYGGLAGVLAWVHLVLWNAGVIGATWLMMYAGYIGGAGALSTAVGGGGLNPGQVHEILKVFPPYIAAFIAVALVGAISGGLGYLAVWILPARRPRTAPTTA